MKYTNRERMFRAAYIRINQILNAPERKIYKELIDLQKELKEYKKRKNEYQKYYERYKYIACLLAEKLADQNKTANYWIEWAYQKRKEEEQNERIAEDNNARN